MDALLTRLVDDAALFPPGNAPMAAALPAHRDHRTSWYADLVGPFLCPDRRLPDLLDALPTRNATALPVGVIGTGSLDQVLDAAAAVDDDPRLALSSVDYPLAADCPDGDFTAAAHRAVAALGTDLPNGVPAYVEVPQPTDHPDVLDILASSELRAKLRCGGTTPESFPSEHEVAVFVTGCVVRGLRFKCTAGLHEPVRHRDQTTGFEHHGFLNLLAATAAALTTRTAETVASRLAEPDSRELVAMLSDVDGLEIRRSFCSFGTCSINEPRDGLLTLGLLTKP